MLVVGCGNLPAGSLLLCIVSLNGSTEQVLVSFFDRLLHENYVVFRSGIVNVHGVELSIVVSKASLALTMGNSFLSFKKIYYNFMIVLLHSLVKFSPLTPTPFSSIINISILFHLKRGYHK